MIQLNFNIMHRLDDPNATAYVMCFDLLCIDLLRGLLF